MKNIPNILTTMRIVLTFGLIYFLYQPTLSGKIWALIIFSLASITDFFDGYLARKYKLISNYGKLMDPIADKFLTLSVFFIVAQQGYIAMWMFIVIALREIIITLARLIIMKKKVVLAAEQAGKIKTVLQIVAEIVILMFIIADQIAGFQGSSLTAMIWKYVINVLMYAVVFVTLYSGFTVFWNNRKIFYER